MKILHTGDIHIRGDEYAEDVERALSNMAQFAKDEAVDLVVIGGDVFESVSTPRQRLTFRAFLDALPEKAGKVIIRGNHDQSEDLSIYADPFRGIFVFEKPGAFIWNGLQILTLPHFNPSLVAREEFSLLDLKDSGTDLLSDILDYFFQKVHVHDGPSILVAHADVDGAMYREGYVPKDNGIHLDRTKLASLRIPVMLDHIHKHQELAPCVLYSGSPARMNFGEANDDKGCILWLLENGLWRWAFKSLNPRPMYNFTGGWDNEHGWHINEEHEALDLRDARVKFVYEVSEAEINQVDLDLINEYFGGAYDLKIEMRPRLSTATRTAEIVEARTLPDKLILWGKAKGHTDKIPGLLACHQELTGETVQYTEEEGSHGETTAQGNAPHTQEPDPQGIQTGPSEAEAAPETGDSQPTPKPQPVEFFAQMGQKGPTSLTPISQTTEVPSKPVSPDLGGSFLSEPEVEQQALTLF